MKKLKPIQNMLLGMAIGDAFGSAYEFAGTNEFIKKHFNIQQYDDHISIKGSGRIFQTTPKGMYTDDSQMSIALAKTLLTSKTHSQKDFAQQFVATFKENPINGYARRFQKLLENISDGDELLERLSGHNDSIRNGAAMRSLPLGVLNNPKKVMHVAKTQARITHNTIEGIVSSQMIGLLSWLFRNKPEINTSETYDLALNYLDKEGFKQKEYLSKVKTLNKKDVQYFFDKKKKGVPCNGMKTVAAVMHTLNHYNTATEILRESILLGGDTDSVASLSLGLYAIKHSIDDLPEQLFTNLNNEIQGKDYLLQLGKELENKFGIKK